jgi:hypothetical protein
MAIALGSEKRATLADVIRFYEMRFNIRFTPQEKADLIAFLNSL